MGQQYIDTNKALHEPKLTKQIIENWLIKHDPPDTRLSASEITWALVARSTSKQQAKKWLEFVWTGKNLHAEA